MALPILKERPLTLREAVIPYVMCGINMLAPTLATRDLVFPQVFVVALLFILLGLPCSIYFRRRKYHHILLNLITLVPLLVITWALVRTHPGLQIDWADPISSIFAGENGLLFLEGLLNALVLLAAGRAFLLVNSKELMQTSIPGISIFLLAVVTDPQRKSGQDIVSLVCLLLLFSSALYLFSQDHSQQWFSIHTPFRIQRRLATWALLFVLLLFPVSVLLGFGMKPLTLTSLQRAYRQHGSNDWSGGMNWGSRPTVEFEENLAIGGGGDWFTNKQLIMTVTVEGTLTQNLLWRGGSYAYYTNGQWREAPQGDPSMQPDEVTVGEYDGVRREHGPGRITIDPQGRYADPGLRAALATGVMQLPPLADEADVMPLPEGIVKQTFSVEAVTSGRTPVYGTYQAYQAYPKQRSVYHSGIAADGQLFLMDAGGARIGRYTVLSVTKPSPTTLKLPSVALTEEERQQYQRYLQLPADPDVRKRLLQLATRYLEAKHVNWQTSPFEAVHQLQLFLNSEPYTYNLNVGPAPRGSDPMLHFLDKSHEGFCVHFASAMVLLCRSVNIPARMVVGFASGEEVAAQNAGEDARVTKYKVFGSHAHAWVEVFLPEYGWYTIDPTPGGGEQTSTMTRIWDAITGFFTMLKGTIIAWAGLFQQNRHVRIYTELAGGIVLLGCLALYLWRRERPPRFPTRALTSEEARQVILAAYARMHRWLNMWGVRKPREFTAREFQEQFITLNPPMGSLVRELSGLYLQAVYGARPMTDAQARQAIQRLHELWAMARKERKALVITREA